MQGTTFAWVLATAGGAIALSLLLAACGPSNGAGPQIANSGAPSPGEASAAPTPTATTQPVIEKLPTSLEKYRDMTVEQFAAIPRPEQALYLSWLIKDMPAFITAWKNQRNTETDVYEPPSETNSPQIAVADEIWLKRMVLSFSASDANKAMLASVTGGITDRIYLRWKGLFIDKVAPGNPAGLAESNSFPIPKVTNTPVLAKSSDGRSYYDGNEAVDPYGQITKGPSYLNTFPSYDGKTVSWWSGD